MRNIRIKTVNCIKNIYLNIFKINLVGEFIRFKNIKKIINNIDNEHIEIRNILDAGCGGGLYTSYLSEKFPESKIIACDITNNAARKFNQNVTFLIKNLLALEFKNIFDLVICVDVLEHIRDDEKVIENFNASLKNNGSLIIHVPIYPLEYKYIIKSYHQDDHIIDGYRKGQLEFLLRKHNFEIISSISTFNAIEAFIWEIGFILRKNELSKIIYWVIFPFFSLILRCNFAGNKKGNGILIYAKKSMGQ